MSTARDFSADAENEVARAFMSRVVSVVRPVTERVVAGEYELLPIETVDLRQVQTAVFMATGCMVREVVFVRSEDLMARTEPLLYKRTLGRGIETLFGFRLLTSLGSARWGTHRNHFGYGTVIPLHAHLSYSPQRLPWENLRSALFHFWGLALARQERLLERLNPLVELLPRAIPLGELSDRPGVWEVMVA